LNENIGYIHYASFTDNVSEQFLNHVLTLFKDCKGIVVDIRNNGGGSVANVNKLACRFTNESKVLTGYDLHKTGKGHNDFGDTIAVYLTAPSSKVSQGENQETENTENLDGQKVRFTKDVVLLTNRTVFSAANDFVRVMKVLDNVTVIGDHSGGGGAVPVSFNLPNGWSVRLSTTPSLDINFEHTEFGLDPDIKVDMAPDASMTGHDAILDKAIEYLLAK
jgi:C-terminal processing protease CtpA/Prc